MIKDFKEYRKKLGRYLEIHGNPLYEEELTILDKELKEFQLTKFKPCVIYDYRKNNEC